MRQIQTERKMPPDDVPEIDGIAEESDSAHESDQARTSRGFRLQRQHQQAAEAEIQSGQSRGANKSAGRFEKKCRRDHRGGEDRNGDPESAEKRSELLVMKLIEIAEQHAEHQ